MANQNNKNFVETLVETQKKAMDTMVDNTKKFANGNNMVNDTVQKGSEWYKNWLDSQKAIFTKASDKNADMNKNMQENAAQLNEYYQNWFNNQLNQAKQMWEMNTSFFQNAMAKNKKDNNTMNMWNNMASN